MARNSIRDYSNVNSSNTDIQSIDISEGCSPAGINNAIREVMADLKDVSTGAVALESPAFDSASLTGNLTFGDDDKCIFGAGSDLQIWHDTSSVDSKIVDTGSGNLRIMADNLRLQTAAGTANYATADNGGAFSLYYNGSAKLATTATGIDVTGNVESDSVTIGVSSVAGSEKLRVNGTVLTLGGSVSAPAIGIGDTNTGVYAPSAGQLGWTVNGTQRLFLNSTGIDVTGTATMDGLTVDGAAAINGSNLSLDNAYYLAFRNAANTSDIGTLTFDANDQVVIDPNQYGTVIGTSANPSFKVSGNRDISFYDDTGTSQALFWDASAESLGIGTTSPLSAAKLHLQSDSDVYLAFRKSTGTYSYVKNDGTNIWLSSSLGTTGDKFGINMSAPDNSMTIDSSGNVGIGTDSPDVELEVSNSSLANAIKLGASSGARELTFVSNAVNGTNTIISGGDSAATPLLFSIGATASPTEAMRIDAGGRVMIAETSNSGYSANADDLIVGDNGAATERGISIGSTAGGGIRWNDGADAGIIQYVHSSNAMQFYTANSLAATIDSSGNVGIGTTSPTARLTIDNSIATTYSTTGYAATPSNSMLYLNNTNGGSNTASLINFRAGSGDGVIGFVEGGGTNDADFVIQTDGNLNGVERFRITNSGDVVISDSGRFTQGSNLGTSGGTGGFELNIDSNSPRMNWYNDAGATRSVMYFYYEGAERGSIQVLAGSTSYLTSSDYRLKENVIEMTGALDRVKQLQPKKFNFTNDTNNTVDGFLAHEVQDRVPEAISGEKDGVKEEEYEVTPAVLDDDGNIVTEAVMGTREVPEYQGIDQSKLVPLLTKAIQELSDKVDNQQTIIDNLTTRIETLENA